MTEPMQINDVAELLIEALRTVNAMSGVLNDASSALSSALGEDADNSKFSPVHDALRRRFSDASGVHLFSAAAALNIDLPPDLRGEERQEETP